MVNENGSRIFCRRNPSFAIMEMVVLCPLCYGWLSAKDKKYDIQEKTESVLRGPSLDTTKYRIGRSIYSQDYLLITNQILMINDIQLSDIIITTNVCYPNNNYYNHDKQ